MAEPEAVFAFTQGPLFYMLRNRFYVGEVRFKNEICPGPQPALHGPGAVRCGAEPS